MPPTNEANDVDSDDDMFIGDMVAIRVGSDDQEYMEFHIHLSLLRRQSAFFAKMCASPIICRNGIDLPDEDPRQFKSIVKSLYGKSVPLIKPPFTSKETEVDAPIPDLDPRNHETEKLLKKIINDTMRTTAGKQFKNPVEYLFPELAQDYHDKISNPIDLEAMKVKLTEKAYINLKMFNDDVELLESNALSYNGANDDMTDKAKAVRMRIFSKIKESYSSPEAAPLQVQAVLAIPEHPSPRDLLALFILTEKYEFAKIADQVMESIMNYQLDYNCHLSKKDISFIYKETKPGSKLRLFAAKLFAWVLLTQPKEEGPDVFLTKTTTLCSLATTYPDLQTLVFTLLRGHNDLVVEDPLDAPLCDFHWHGKDERCPCEPLPAPVVGKKRKSYNQDLSRHSK